MEISKAAQTSQLVNERVSVTAFGAKGDFVADDTAAFQAALDYVASLTPGSFYGGKVFVPPGNYKISSTLTIYKGTHLQGASKIGAILSYTGSGAMLEAPDTGDINAYIQVSDLHLYLTTSAKAIDFTRIGYSDFKNLRIELRASNSTAIYGMGYQNTGGTGVGPYFNNFDSITIIGRNDGATYPNQNGVVLASDTVGTGVIADGPNANNFSNFNRVAGVDRAFDVQSGNGNLFTNIQVEQVQSSAFRFNYRAADLSGTATGGTVNTITGDFSSLSLIAGGGTVSITGGTNSGEYAIAKTSSTSTTLNLGRGLPVACDGTSTFEYYYTKANGNRVVNLRCEGANTAKIVEFSPGSQQNRIVNTHLTGLSSTYYTDYTKSFSNSVGTELTRFAFYAENLTSSASTTLTPLATSFQGGMSPHQSYVLEGVVVDSHLHSAGACDVKIYRSGSLIKTITNALTGTRLYTCLEPEVTATSTSNLIQADQRLSVVVDTDGSWTSSGAADISVVILLRCLT